MAEKKRRRGRPSVVEPHKERIIEMLAQGYSMRAIANEFDTHVTSVERGILRWEKEGEKIVRARRPRPTPAQKELLARKRLQLEKDRQTAGRIQEKGERAAQKLRDGESPSEHVKELREARDSLKILAETETRAADLVKIRQAIVAFSKELDALKPKPKPKPEDDPMNKGCTDVLLARGERERKAALETLKDADRDTLLKHITGDTA